MLALYRKYRPKTLAEVVGQDQVTRPLDGALKSGKVSHSYLFTGPRGCGKTSVARILAHEINGFKYELEDSYLDIIEIDAASNTGVDNIRDLREKAMVAPSEGKFKVYIIDEVHMLSKSAFNALLKTLEEPPAHVVFILATTDLEKVPITITSRSQVFTFRLAPPDVMLPHLRQICEKEHIKIEDSALNLIIEKGGGSFRDSLSLLDQISGLGDGKAIDEQTVANSLGLPLDSAISSLLSAYTSANSPEITKILKDLLNSGLKPESIASSALSRIISSPTPELLPLLASLPTVSAPYPEAKLLLAFLDGLKARGTNVESESKTPFSHIKEKPPVESSFSSGGGEDDSSRESFSPKTEETYIPDGPDRFARQGGSAGVPAYDVPAGLRQTPERVSDRKPRRETTLTLTPALRQQLEKCKLVESESQIDIYPPKKIIKAILERPGNSEILKSNFNKDFVIHNPDELEKSPELQQISDIMGGAQEVNNDNGGIPF